MAFVKDFRDNTYADSILVARLRTIDLKKAGEIAGQVNDNNEEGTGRIYLMAEGVDGSRKQKIRLEAPGSFKFERLPEGRYTLSAFRDGDNSGSFSTGRPFPFVPSERFLIGSDTLKVRARWAVEGVTITLP
jgi:uncharacterized protein (DUF2141 family)